MNKVRKIALIFAIGLSLCGCGLFKNVPKNNENSTTLSTPAMFGKTAMINLRQLDSICVVDGLSTNLEDWLKSTYVDYETNMPVNRYAFIKVLNEHEEMMYILMPVDTLYKLTKRYVKEVEDE